MLIMITMDKICHDINYNIIILQCNCTVTVRVISQQSLNNLHDYFSDIIIYHNFHSLNIIRFIIFCYYLQLQFMLSLS